MNCYFIPIYFAFEPYRYAASEGRLLVWLREVNESKTNDSANVRNVENRGMNGCFSG